MDSSTRLTALLLSLIGSTFALLQLGLLALTFLVIVPVGNHVNSYQVPALQLELLAFYLFETLLAFSGAIVAYVKPLGGGSILLVSGAAPIAFELLFIIQIGEPLAFSSIAALEFISPTLLLVAGLIALVKRTSWPPHQAIKKKEAGSSRLPA